MTAAPSEHAAPKVSVCVIAFNQVNYIRACLQSIVDQKTDFPFEVIVGDDDSTDGTAAIIREFQDRYPRTISAILNRLKIGGTQNYVTTHKRARGEYVAHLDGDDLALPGKLQKQADYLDAHPQVAVVWHALEVFDDAGAKSPPFHRRLDDVVDPSQITQGDILRFGSLGGASSIMYRRRFATYLDEIMGDTLDYYFAARLTEGGHAAKMAEVLGSYRYNPGTVTLSKRASPYFRSSPMRLLYASHLRDLYAKNSSARDDIFLNALFNLAVELRFLRRSAWPFLNLVGRTVSLAGIRQIPRYVRKALWLRTR